MACEGCGGNADDWPPRLLITYVDGTVDEGGNVHDWADARADGVSRIDIGRGQHAGSSFYWLYKEDIGEGEIAWVSGGFSIHDIEAHEFIHRENGERLARKVRSIPDLKHDQVKLGWWWKKKQHGAG